MSGERPFQVFDWTTGSQNIWAAFFDTLSGTTVDVETTQASGTAKREAAEAMAKQWNYRPANPDHAVQIIPEHTPSAGERITPRASPIAFSELD